jgi:hypothetical protein
MPGWIIAAFWGWFAVTLLLGAKPGYMLPIPQRAIAVVMAFGSGVLISALSFDLRDDAHQRGGLDSTAIGFLAGAPSLRWPTGSFRDRERSTERDPGHNSYRRRTIPGADWQSPWADC